jgi:hypothetical protein
LKKPWLLNTNFIIDHKYVEKKYISFQIGAKTVSEKMHI